MNFKLRKNFTNIQVSGKLTLSTKFFESCNEASIFSFKCNKKSKAFLELVSLFSIIIFSGFEFFLFVLVKDNKNSSALL